MSIIVEFFGSIIIILITLVRANFHFKNFDVAKIYWLQ